MFINHMINKHIFREKAMKKVAIVGCGGIAGVHAVALQKIPDVEMVSFVDIRRDRAERFSLQYTAGQASVYENITDMFANEKLDVIHICTPHYLHVPMAIMALNNGVSFFSEKPPAINMEQYNELCEAYKCALDVSTEYDCKSYEKNQKLCAGFCFQNRYNETIRKTDSILATGTLGQITGARAFVNWRRDEAYYQTDWKGKLSTEGGGALINQSIHTLDLMLRYLGEPKEVKASLSNHHLQGVIEVEDTVDAWMTFNDGKRACFYATTAYVSDAPVILELQCEHGSITMINKDLIVTTNGTSEVLHVEENAGPGKDYWGNGHLSCIKDYYEKMDSGEPFMNDLDGVRNTMETMMRIYEYRG